MIYFVDPKTGETYPVAETKTTIDAAYELGYLPKTEKDIDAADRVDGEDPNG